jgi:hypothetical protein
VTEYTHKKIVETLRKDAALMKAAASRYKVGQLLKREFEDREAFFLACLALLEDKRT